MGIGGGIISRKLLFAVFLIASLSLSGISSASAVEQGTVQTQTYNTNTQKTSVNTQLNDVNISKQSANMQKSAETNTKKATQTKTTEKQSVTTTKSTVNPVQNTANTATSTEKANTSSTETKSTVSSPTLSQNTATETQTLPSTTNTTQTQTLTPVNNTTTETQASPVNNTPIANTSNNNQSTAAEPANLTKNATQSSVNTQEEPQAAAGNTYTDVHGIWLKAEDVSKVSVSSLTNANITDIFVKTNLLTAPTYQTVLSEIVSKFQNTGIRIHAWITCFKDANGNWVDPANATQRAFLISSITNIVKNYGVDGIQLDYVRYSGVGDNAAYNHANATETITSFVNDVWKAVKAINPDVAVSTVVMPEGSSNAYLYGQDYKSLAQYVDFMVPMIYKGNYNKDTAWIGTTTKYIVGQAGSTPVIAGLQTYISDYDTTPLPASELNQDIKSATDNGASGYALFRYGTISQDFFTPSSFTINQINDAAARVKAYIETNHALPNYVTIGTNQVLMTDFLKLMVKDVLQINSGTTTPIALKDISDPDNSTGTFKSGNIYKTEYLDMAKRINAFLDSNGLAPSYATSKLGKISYESLVYMYAKILSFYKTNNYLPNYVSMNSAMKISVPVASGSSGQTVTTFTLEQIQGAASKVKTYIDTNHVLPNYVTIGTNQVSMTDFLRLMLTGTLEINKGVNMPVSLKTVKAPATPSENITSGNINLTDYIDLANRLTAYIDANGALPNYATSTLGNIKYESLVYMYAKILNFESSNNYLPSYVSVTPWSTSSSTGTGSTVTTVPAELQKYLAATANCQVNDPKIKALAASITAGKTTTYAKAVAIFNWVRDNLSYSFYYNTKYGAVGALNARTGNCVDTAHLVIALERAAGIPAEYEHVYARFTSGNWYGHVIAKVWVDGKWYYADATSSKNTFGVVNNWNTATATVKGIYASLPF